jgi:hypothetical protein
MNMKRVAYLVSELRVLYPTLFKAQVIARPSNTLITITDIELPKFKVFLSKRTF